MSEPFLGEIRLVAFNFAPLGWADCNGQILPIQQNVALFSLLGTTYGGNGTTNFALPNLQGRVAMHLGSGHVLGEFGGTENVILTTAQIPSHTHAPRATNADQTTDLPTGALLSGGGVYAAPPANVTLDPSAIGLTGGGQPHQNMQPYLTARYIIALQGIFPSPN